MKKLLKNDGLIGKLKSYNAIEIKVSFEDEGADFIDILRLKFLCIEANIPITLKIAGPEAIRDIKDANKLNIVKLVAPMVESSFALTKYVAAVEKYMNVDNQNLGVNIETINAVENFNEMRRNVKYKKLNSITIGRGDLVQSMEKDRYDGAVDSKEVLDICIEIFTKVKADGKLCMLGGSMTEKSKEFVEVLVEKQLLDKFETRNIIFNTTAMGKTDFKDLINLALELEYDQMSSRREYYESLYNQDYKRIKRLSHLV
jgi:4-hydroxy-2-oxoheptanedioate aldolase